MQVESILIGWSRAARATVLEAALELPERAKMRADVKVRVHHVALQQISVAVAIRIAEIGVVEKLVPFARIPSKREVRVQGWEERDVLDRIPCFGAAGGILQERIVFEIARLGEPRSGTIGRLLCLCARLTSREVEQHAKKKADRSSRHDRERSTVTSDEAQQIGVDDFRMRSGHAVRQPRIGLQRSLLEELDRETGTVVDRNDLIVLAMHDERGHVDRL